MPSSGDSMLRACVIALVVGCGAPSTGPAGPADRAAEGEDFAFEDQPEPRAPERVPEPAAIPLPTDDLEAAFKLADAAFANGDYVTAAGYFKSLYEQMPHPAFLHNLAECLRQLRDCYGAVKYFAWYLEADPDAKNRDRVEGKLAELRNRCPDA